MKLSADGRIGTRSVRFFFREVPAVIPQNSKCFIHFFVVATLLSLIGCGSSLNSTNSNDAAAENTTTKAENSRYGVVQIPLSPEQLDAANAGAKFQGCWYKSGHRRYQAVDVTVTTPGTYTFNADLYYGTTCDPKTQADQFGFGQKIDFGGFGYIFWFDAFADKSDMSALWQVGTDTSKCVDYETAPACP
jgi:hypothetical protein